MLAVPQTDLNAGVVPETDLSAGVVPETDLSAGVVPQTGRVQGVDLHLAVFTEQFTFLEHLHAAEEDPTLFRSGDHLNLHKHQNVYTCKNILYVYIHHTYVQTPHMYKHYAHLYKHYTYVYKHNACIQNIINTTHVQPNNICTLPLSVLYA